MPFADLYRPSIQLGLLTAIAGRHGFPVRTLHAHLEFGAQIGAGLYQSLALHRGRMTGEWLFSAAAFGGSAPDPDDRFLADFATELPAPPDTLRELRTVAVPAFLDRLLDTEDWESVRVAGFTSTFQQNAASFALARRLKQRHPGIVTVFGGANFDGPMGAEYLRRLDFVDVVVTGEGDTVLPRLLDALAAGGDPGPLPGVAHRLGPSISVTPPAVVPHRLDDLPFPDYTEYFARAERLGLISTAAQRDVAIPFESARGCWWGEKHHCVFCGLNGTTMRFRAKSPDRVLAELTHQARRYRGFRFEAVDNILDAGYLTTLLPRLTEQTTGFEIFYEVKANLTRGQVRALADAGVRAVQPGIESLSSTVLRLMRKGVRAAQNVNLLRWARYYGIDVSWNILWGFPGEQAGDYAGQAAAVPHLVHLQPPDSAGRIWMERFSPLHTDQASFPVRHRAPERSYRYVYPAAIDLDEVAYFFEYDLAGALPDSAYADLAHAVTTWQATWAQGRTPALRYWSAPGLVQIHDARWPGREGTYTFDGILADIYLAVCDRPATVTGIGHRLGGATHPQLIREAVAEFGRRGLMFLDDGLAVAVALPATGGR
ncbi:radical SAM protein [Actinoplanes awajinensis subsp. mycoplanecinus]|uniref:Radical SAM protein n=2 Tax=Actinoplanes awajinensis TaxID=135946 RepID=A0A117MPD6_9ACTN|nr:radical SAM protein [Actinoplanes awajinensis subsp. mycoplanecinus]